MSGQIDAVQYAVQRAPANLLAQVRLPFFCILDFNLHCMQLLVVRHEAIVLNTQTQIAQSVHATTDMRVDILTDNEWPALFIPPPLVRSACFAAITEWLRYSCSQLLRFGPDHLGFRDLPMPCRENITRVVSALPLHVLRLLASADALWVRAATPESILLAQAECATASVYNEQQQPDTQLAAAGMICLSNIYLLCADGCFVFVLCLCARVCWFVSLDKCYASCSTLATCAAGSVSVFLRRCERAHC